MFCGKGLLACVFQDPMSLGWNPVFTVATQICEPLIVWDELQAGAARAEGAAYNEVGIPDPSAALWQPLSNEMSAASSSSVMIAVYSGLCAQALIADEPTTALT